MGRRLMTPRPGDFAVVDTLTRTSRLIQLGEVLSGGGFTMFDHAVICSRVRRDGTVYIVEATPRGAEETVWHYDDHDHLWSTGIVKTSTRAGKAALAYLGTPYSWLDYAAIAARASHLWAPGLRHYVASTKHLVSGQLVDRAELDAGVHLLTDRRWPGWVRPPIRRRFRLSLTGSRLSHAGLLARPTVPARGPSTLLSAARSGSAPGAARSGCTTPGTIWWSS